MGYILYEKAYIYLYLVGVLQLYLGMEMVRVFSKLIFHPTFKLSS